MHMVVCLSLNYPIFVAMRQEARGEITSCLNTLKFEHALSPALPLLSHVADANGSWLLG